ncbi:MAG: dockerin type I repeat-containing protein [Bacteroidaceae bacterium]|nr:dockerin type I repeat-containing protein [Bacteroidaceae bacterium]
MSKYLILYIMLVCMPMAARGQTISDVVFSDLLQAPAQAQSLSYWFDANTDNIQTASGLTGTYTLDLAGLNDGIHVLHYQLKGTDGKIYALSSAVFLKMISNDSDSSTGSDIAASKLLYWFDADAEDVQTSASLSGTFILDTSVLNDGLHTLHYQLIGTDGKTYAISSAVFIKMMSISEEISSDAAVAKQMRYWFNDDNSSIIQTDIANGIQSIDVSVLPNGINTVHYQLVYDNCQVSPPATGIFLKDNKLPGCDVENGIVKYQYWLNDNNSTMQTVTLGQSQNPYSLISLLQVEKMPLRSSAFHFEVNDGQPTIYALNDFHIRFHDMLTYFAEDSKKYIDYSTKQIVEPIGELLPTQTFSRVDDNDIRWFTVGAEAGDSLAFKASHATTIQLFSPSGEELYTAQGPTSVVYGGCHTWESGTHYLAVHDVMGSKPTMTIDYLHMDKYDVVDWDVHVVGNGGYNSILFKGNGFHDLVSVDLALGSSIITSDSIGHESDAETTVRFDFDGAELGEYKAIFHFADDDLEVENCLTVEEATEIELDADVFFANTFLFGRGNTYTFQYHNNSNMTAYDVPFAVYIFTPKHLNDSILDPHTYIKVGGYDLEKHYKELLGEYYTDSLNAIIQAKRQLTGDTYYLLDDTIPDYLSGYPYARHTFIQTTLHPNETKTFTIHVNIMTDMYVYIYSPTNWNITERVVNQGSNIQAIRRKVSEKVHCTPSDWVKANECAQRDLLDGKEAHKNMGKIDCEKLPLECRPKHGGHGKGRGPQDPNEIYGYFTETGSKFIADTVDKVNYTIEFENDTTFATASAHTIVIRDTLDNSYFNMHAFMPTKVRIGNHDLFLTDNDISTSDNVTSFVKTIDMRPEIYAIAQVEGTYSQATGIAEWRFTSLDPMTMEPTDDIMQGILPVNYDGTSGIGEVMFEIGVKANKGDGAQIANRAGIVFDYEEAILTPTWVNTVDAVAPTSTILGGIQTNDSTLTLRLAGEDARSGVWRYTVYAQMGEGASWELVAENVTDTLCDVRIYDGIEYGFLVLATDSAGNVEHKSFEEADFQLTTVTPGDANGDGTVDALDVVLVTSYYLGGDVFLNLAAADVNADGEVNSLDVVAIQNIYLNATSGKALAPRKRARKFKRD